MQLEAVCGMYAHKWMHFCICPSAGFLACIAEMAKGSGTLLHVLWHRHISSALNAFASLHVVVVNPRISKPLAVSGYGKLLLQLMTVSREDYVPCTCARYSRSCTHHSPDLASQSRPRGDWSMPELLVTRGDSGDLIRL